jgi:hypothetical protein
LAKAITFYTNYKHWLKPTAIQNRKMKQKIVYAIIAFLVAFGTTFYVIRTYFPKHKVEKTAIQKDTLTKPQQ